MLKVKTFVFNPFQVNTYIISNERRESFIIDAACSNETERGQMTDYINNQNLIIKALINTHCHVDHLLGVEYLRAMYQVPFYCSEEDQGLIDNAIAQGRFFGLDVEKPGKPDRYITEEDRLDLGGHAVKIFHVPGHSPGSLAFFVENENKLFTGDILFSGSIGRTDLPGGSYQTLIAGIREKLLVLNDATEVFPGHGESTTIGREKLLNPYLQ